MKNTFLLSTFLFLFFLTSCSNNEENLLDDSSDKIEKLIKQIEVQNPDYPNYYNQDTFIYENNRLVKAWFYGCSGVLYEFEYGSNGKISTVYSQNQVSYSDIGISIKNSGSIIKQTYDVNDKLTSLTDASGKVVASLDYDSEGRLYKIDIKDFLIGKPDVYIYSSFDSNGNPLKDNFESTFSYDNNVNPIYILFSKFGFFNVEMCNSLDKSRGFYISPNNVKEVISDINNEIIFSASYSYDSDGYPISNSYSSSRGSYTSNVEDYKY